MNFSEYYDQTILYIHAVRKLGCIVGGPKGAYKLCEVDFSNLEKISTSAALVLTAELSKWNDNIRQRLVPTIDSWSSLIIKQFSDIGFFELFPQASSLDLSHLSPDKPPYSIVRYIKGGCKDRKKAQVLKEQLINTVGDHISKWNFLHDGLSEAITNVSHHAYPEWGNFKGREKYWYLTGSFSESNRVLKIVFYDQGIGIPKTLPVSEIWERVLLKLSKLPLAERKRDEQLLSAAITVGRTRTKKPDRGKGLQNLLEFIRQRKNGYLAIFSLKGLFKLTIDEAEEKVKKVRFKTGMPGTLIIWSVRLGNH